MEELAQSLGNAKIREEFDLDAAMPFDPNTNDECLFQRLVELNPPLGRDVALSLLTQWIAQLPPLDRRKFSDALLRAYTIARDSSLHWRD